MIGMTLTLLKRQLESYMSGRNGWQIGTNKVQVLNIAELDFNGTSSFEEGIIISCINVEQESSLRNFKSVQKSHIGGVVEYKTPSFYTNLYILFSAYAKTNNYQKSLTWLAYTINFFQAKNNFTKANTQDQSFWDNPSTDWDELTENQKRAYKLSMNPLNQNISEMNQLWSTLGSRQIPCMLYKGKLIELKDTQILGAGALINNLKSTEIIN